ncbi:hypothetical protein JG688_00017801 [Phytophthora aleatoria]|uniref:Uncharacterized protein n=1 Tax=Phytophthora aleatoria TaxID=2496075 RepID=A0A8J5I9V0_9STRA|nr:hypothetical protein JG688_00017801 [Phytophthora aleatoria]
MGGFNNTNAATMLISVLYAQRKAEDRFVVCSSLSLGKGNEETDRRAKIDFFVMYSWTQDEYIAASTHQKFYDKAAFKFDH